MRIDTDYLIKMLDRLAVTCSADAETMGSEYLATFTRGQAAGFRQSADMVRDLVEAGRLRL